MNGEIEKIISEHAVTIGVLVHSFKRIEGFMEKTMESQLKQEVIMERLANFEETNGNDHRHIHERIDVIKHDFDEHMKDYGDIKPKVYNGDRAYKAMMWFLGVCGLLALTTLYNTIWGK